MDLLLQILNPKRNISLLPLIINLVIYSLPGVHFFEYFPNGWDRTESAWAIKDNYLPHSLYILYLFLGKSFNRIIPDPTIALSVLSSLFGLLALAWFYLVQLQLMADIGRDGIKSQRLNIFVGLAVLFLATN